MSEEESDVDEEEEEEQEEEEIYSAYSPSVTFIILFCKISFIFK